MRYCIFCGIKIPGDAKYCQICGKQQPESSVSVEASAADTEKKGLAALLDSPQKLIIAGIGAFVTVLIIATLIMVAILR